MREGITQGGAQSAYLACNAKATARKYDANNWYTVRANPLSKVGVFPYSGTQIGGDPTKVYQVLRPEEELSNRETIESFKLVPFIDNHVMLGDGDGLTPAERKGVEGVTGEEIFYKDGVLYGNIKVLSENLAGLIDSGKRELSLGYRCEYEFTSGVWNGQPYDAIQRKIRGNHVALVDEGRMGKEVAVLDHLKFTFDTKELKMPKEIEELTKLVNDMSAKLTQALDDVADLKKSAADKAEGIKGIDEDTEKKETKDEDKEKSEDMEEKKEAKDEESKKEDSKDMDYDKEEKKDSKAMDSKLSSLESELNSLKSNGVKSMFSEISARNTLAEKISNVVGTFDASDKTLSEVAEYGVEKLNITCEKGNEMAALDGFFQGHKSSKGVYGLDASSKTNVGMDEKFVKFLTENSIA